MNDDRHDIIGMIENVVRKQTAFYKHYIAQVVDNQDELNKGRVAVIIPEMGILTNDNSIWTYPRYNSDLKVPKIICPNPPFNIYLNYLKFVNFLNFYCLVALQTSLFI